MSKPIINFIKYFFSTFVGTFTDTVVLFIMSTYVLVGSYVGENVISPIISFECMVLANFIMAYNVIWKDRVKERNAQIFFKLYLKFNLSNTCVFLLKLMLLQVLVLLTGWDVVICNLIALCCTGLLNYVMGEKVIFKSKRAI